MSSELSLPSAASAALVLPDHSAMISAGGDALRAQLALSHADMQVIQSGISLYFDPAKNERAAQWIQTNRPHLQNITRIGHETAAVKSGLADVSVRITAATQKQREVADQLVDVKDQARRAADDHKQASSKLSEQLSAVRQSIQQEQRWSLWSFQNPLTHKLGQIAVSVGQYALSGAVAAVAYSQKELLTASCSNPLSSPVAALSCISTLTNPRIYVTLAVGAAVAFVCQKGIEIAGRILKKQQKASELEDNLRAQNEQHLKAAADFEHQESELNNQSSQARESVETAQKDRTVLDARRDQLEDRLSALRTTKTREIARTQLDQLRDAIDQKEQNPFVQRSGAAAVNTFLDAVVLAYAEQSPLAIAAAPASVPQIEEVQ